MGKKNHLWHHPIRWQEIDWDSVYVLLWAPSPGLCLMARGQMWVWESDNDSASATSNVPLSAMHCMPSRAKHISLSGDASCDWGDTYTTYRYTLDNINKLVWINSSHHTSCADGRFTGNTATKQLSTQTWGSDICRSYIGVWFSGGRDIKSSWKIKIDIKRSLFITLYLHMEIQCECCLGKCG